MISAPATLIALRESLEAFLIISILAGLATKLGHREARGPLLWGSGAALGATIVAGFLLDTAARELIESSGSAEAFEGIASLLAVGILTYMIVWMYRHTLSMVEGMRQHAHAALASGRPLLFFALGFVAVAREGLETILLFATLASTTTASALLLSGLVGLAASAVTAWLVFSGIVRLNIKKFFAVSGVLLIFFAGGLLMTSVHEFAEVGVVPETANAWNTEPLLDQHSAVGSLVKAVFGYREKPSILEAAAYFLYVLGLGAWYLRGVHLLGRHGIAAPTKP